MAQRDRRDIPVPPILPFMLQFIIQRADLHRVERHFPVLTEEKEPVAAEFRASVYQTASIVNAYVNNITLQNHVQSKWFVYLLEAGDGLSLEFHFLLVWRETEFVPIFVIA